MTPKSIEALLRADDTAMRALDAVRAHGPKGAYIAAGFIRNRLWDSFYDPAPVALPTDTDVVFFDPTDLAPETDAHWEARLETACAGQAWQVRNQSRMHLGAGDEPYGDLTDALSRWPETATAVALRLERDGSFSWIAPFGFDDLAAHTLRPTPAILARDPEIFVGRYTSKGWLKRWPWLRVKGGA